MPFTITNSSRNTFLDCPWKYFLEYVMKLSPREEAKYFTWGKLLHMTREIMRGGKMPDDAIAHLRELIETQATDEFINTPIEQLEIYLNLLHYVLGAHLLKYPDDATRYESLGIEHRFRLPLIIPGDRGEDKLLGYFQGKIDDVVRQVYIGDIFEWETKTAALVDEKYWIDKTFDSQPKGYLLAVQRCLGFQTCRVIYDIFSKPQIRQKKTETEEAFQKRLGETYLLERDKYLIRHELSFTQEDIDSYYWELCNVAEEILWCQEQGIYVRHHPSNRFGRCQFQSICLNVEQSDAINDFAMRSQYHPELSKGEDQ